MKKRVKIVFFAMTTGIIAFLLWIAFMPVLYDAYMERKPGIDNFSDHEVEYRILADFINGDLKASRSLSGRYFISMDPGYDFSECIRERCIISKIWKDILDVMNELSISSIFHYQDDRLEFKLTDKVTELGTVYVYHANGFRNSAVGDEINLRGTKDSYIVSIINDDWAIVSIAQ